MQDPPEEGEVPGPPEAAQPDQLLLAVQGVQAQLATISGNQLTLEEDMQKLTSRLTTLERQRPQQQSAAAASASAAQAALSAEMDSMKAGLAACKQQVEAARKSLTDLGLTDASAGREMQQALSKGTQAYVEAQQLRDDLKRLKQQFEQSEATRRATDTLVATLRTQVGQLQEQCRAEGAQSELVAWAPADMHPDQLLAALSEAAGLSSRTFVSVERRFVPRDRGSGSGGAGGSSSSSEQGRPRALMALYAIRLISSRHLPTVLGGRTRTQLRRKQVPIWLEQALDEEGRKIRKRLVPVASQLRAEGVKVRWRGVRLEKQVARGDGRREWVQVLPGPPEHDGEEGAAGQ